MKSSTLQYQICKCSSTIVAQSYTDSITWARWNFGTTANFFCNFLWNFFSDHFGNLVANLSRNFNTSFLWNLSSYSYWVLSTNCLRELSTFFPWYIDREVLTSLVRNNSTLGSRYLLLHLLWDLLTMLSGYLQITVQVNLISSRFDIFLYPIFFS